MKHENEPEILSAAQFAVLLGGVQVKSGKHRSTGQNYYLSLPTPLTRELLNQAGLAGAMIQGFPAIRIELAAGLKALIEGACGLIYDLNADLFFFEVLETRRLMVRYHHIIGSRHLKWLTAAEHAALVAAISDGLKLLAGPAATRPLDARLLEDPLQTEIAQLTADASRVYLPEAHLGHYLRIKQALEKAGGKYNRKGHFDFPAGMDASAVLDGLRTGKVVNLKQESQSFFTPPSLALQVVTAAGPTKGRRFLEPNGGQGALADLVRAAGDASELVVVENHPVNIAALQAKGYAVVERDFLSLTPAEIGMFDAIIANPPFSRGQDIEHIRHMLKFLAPGGTLSVIASTSWLRGKNRAQADFRALLREMGAQIYDVPAGTFRAEGTDVATIHIVANQPAAGVVAEAA